jgi:hypothetical protein
VGRAGVVVPITNTLTESGSAGAPRLTTVPFTVSRPTDAFLCRTACVALLQKTFRHPHVGNRPDEFIGSGCLRFLSPDLRMHDVCDLALTLDVTANMQDRHRGGTSAVAARRVQL